MTTDLPARSRPYHIEHPTRGVLTNKSEPLAGAFHFSWSKPRNDESTMTFATLREAVAVFDRISPSIRVKCQVMHYNPNHWRHADPYEVVHETKVK